MHNDIVGLSSYSLGRNVDKLNGAFYLKLEFVSSELEVITSLNEFFQDANVLEVMNLWKASQTLVSSVSAVEDNKF